uniref:Uncharacterized protein n=1 Tax=viral metagenome TaxID=1070528 RepID=A0A6M3XG96_9ZZZZ
MSVSFGKISDTEKQKYDYIVNTLAVIQKNKAELFNLEVVYMAELRKFWFDVGKTYDINSQEIQYTINQDGEIVMV